MTTSPPLARRRFLGGLAITASAAGAASVLHAPEAAAKGRAAENFEVDVAIYVDTFTMIPAPGSAPPVAGFGTPFLVEGGIFAGGSLPGGSDVDTSQHQEVGTWFCRGHFINTLERPNPHIISHQDFLFSTSDLMVPHTIVTSGVEGNDDPEAVFYRAVTGGTGDYAGANGQTIYRSIGTNTRLGPNLRYRFDLVLPAASRRVEDGSEDHPHASRTESR